MIGSLNCQIPQVHNCEPHQALGGGFWTNVHCQQGFSPLLGSDLGPALCTVIGPLTAVLNDQELQ